jgi:hypothetical protein
MTFIAGLGLGILLTIGVALVVGSDIDNNTDFR